METSQPPSSDFLQLGIAAFKAGNKQDARHYLFKAIEKEPNNEQAWLYMAAALDDLDKRRQCLYRVLSINPSSQVASRELARMGAQDAQPVFPGSPPPAVPATVPGTAFAPAIQTILILISVFWLFVSCYQIFVGLTLPDIASGLVILAFGAFNVLIVIYTVLLYRRAKKRQRKTADELLALGLFGAIFAFAQMLLLSSWLNIISAILYIILAVLAQLAKPEFNVPAAKK
jgi:hypothetical protein